MPLLGVLHILLLEVASSLLDRLDELDGISKNLSDITTANEELHCIILPKPSVCHWLVKETPRARKQQP